MGLSEERCKWLDTSAVGWREGPVMTEIVADMGSLENTIKKAASPMEVERAAIRELVVAARARGEDLTGPDGLLKTLTKTVLETALEEELTEHPGYDKHAVEGRGANSRNGKRTKTVVTDAVGPVQIEVPVDLQRDRDGPSTR
jgi:putative transposase